MVAGGHAGGTAATSRARAREDRPYRGRTLEQRRSDQLERLLAAARRVFAERGYAAASIEEIVAAAQVSRSTFYGFFATKEDCLLALLWHDSRRLLEPLREVAASDLSIDAKVRVGVERFVETLARDPQMAQVVLIEAVGAGERVEQARAEARSMFTRLIARELRDVPHWRQRSADEAQLAAMATMAAIAEPVSHLVATGRLREWRALVEPLARYALRALGPDLL